MAFQYLCSLLLEESNQIIAVLGLLETAKCHLGARNVFLWVLEIFKLMHMLVQERYDISILVLTKVPSSHVTALFLFASL